TTRKSSCRCYCSVACCSNSVKKFPYLSFHDFPVDAEIRARWVRAIKRDEGPSFKILHGSTYVCSQHFTPEDISTSASGRTRIKKGATPSRFPWNDWGKGWTLLSLVVL
uniref:THAP domain-containing protein 1 n=1 Tax=Cyprinus carpio TaxID=7962 RepID=A0A8C1KMD5_CYPCA